MSIETSGVDFRGKNLDIPSGFSSMTELNRVNGTRHPETIQEYTSQGLTPPNPGEYSINNDVIVLADSEGKMRAMLPIMNPDRASESKDRFNKAVSDLESMGYVQSNFMVPVFG